MSQFRPYLAHLLLALGMSGFAAGAAAKEASGKARPLTERADPAPYKPPAPPTVTSAKDHTKEARRLFKAKDYAGAVSSFVEAIKLSPEDAKLLLEAGAAALAAGDARAETWTRDALSLASGDAAQESAGYYQLGEILLARDPAAARDAFADSLAARPGKAARAALSKLDPYAPEPMRGPYRALSDWCLEQGRAAKSAGREEALCQTETSELGALVGLSRASTSGSYRDAQLVGLLGSFEAELFLALQTKEGWFVAKRPFPRWRTAPGFFENYHHQLMNYDTENKLTITRFEVSDLVTGGEPELVLSYVHEYGTKEGPGEFFYDYRSEATLYAGLGSSGKPSATREIVSSFEASKTTGSSGKTSRSKAQHTISLSSSGSLSVKAGKKLGVPPLSPEMQSGTGTRPLIFP